MEKQGHCRQYQSFVAHSLVFLVLCCKIFLQWKFSPTYNFQSLYYTDLLIVITYFNCILLIKNYFDASTLQKFKPLLAKSNNQEGFILENNGDQDLLGRKSYAQTISRTILKVISEVKNHVRLV
jgi:hypothetical protein